MSSEGNVKRVDIVIVNDDAEAPSFLNPMTAEIFVTNAVGKFIFEQADGQTSTDEIVKAVMSSFKGAPEDVVRGEVETFVRDGLKKGILEQA